MGAHWVCFNEWTWQRGTGRDANNVTNTICVPVLWSEMIQTYQSAPTSIPPFGSMFLKRTTTNIHLKGYVCVISTNAFLSTSLNKFTMESPKQQKAIISYLMSQKYNNTKTEYRMRLKKDFFYYNFLNSKPIKITKKNNFIVLFLLSFTVLFFFQFLTCLFYWFTTCLVIYVFPILLLIASHLCTVYDNVGVWVRLVHGV